MGIGGAASVGARETTDMTKRSPRLIRRRVTDEFYSPASTGLGDATAIDREHELEPEPDLGAVDAPGDDEADDDEADDDDDGENDGENDEAEDEDDEDDEDDE